MSRSFQFMVEGTAMDQAAAIRRADITPLRPRASPCAICIAHRATMIVVTLTSVLGATLAAGATLGYFLKRLPRAA